MVEVEKDPEGWNKDLYEDLSFENLIKSVKNSTIDAWNQSYEAYLSSEWKRLFPAKKWDPKYISELTSPDSNFVRPDYSAKNFSDRMKRTGLFSGIHLDGANFTHANLNGTDFTGSSLGSANFIGAQLKSAKFNDSHLEGANFNQANLEGIQAISSHFEKANFNLARLEGSQFNKSHLEGANFRFTIVRGTQFINITLDDKTDFTGTYLAEIIIEQNLRRELERNIRNLDTANKNVFFVLKCGCSKLDVILNKAIKPACRECGGLEAFTVDEKVSSGWVSGSLLSGRVKNHGIIRRRIVKRISRKIPSILILPREIRCTGKMRSILNNSSSRRSRSYRRLENSLIYVIPIYLLRLLISESILSTISLISRNMEVSCHFLCPFTKEYSS